jgi:hypothetical protein
LLWAAVATLLLTPVAWLARRAAPQPPIARGLALSMLVALAFCATAAFANPFLMAVLLAYPLLALPRLSFRRGWWAALDALLALPWIGLGVGWLFLAQVYASLLPEYAPPVRVSLFQAFVGLLLYASVALSAAPSGRKA